MNALFIPKFGFIVAGYTTLVSYILFFICNYVAMKRVLRKNDTEDDMYDKPKLFFMMLAFFVLAAFATLLYNYILIRYIAILIMSIILFIFRKKIIALVKQLMNLKKEVKG